MAENESGWRIEWGEDGEPLRVKGPVGPYALTRIDVALLKAARADGERVAEQRVRAERDVELLAVLAAEHAAVTAWIGPCAAGTCLDNVADAMGLGEEFAARVGQKGGG